MHACFLRKTTATSAGTSVFDIAVCICSLWSVVFAQNILFDSFGLPVKTPTCGCLCAQKPFTVPWKEFSNILPQIWKASLNPPLWQSDEVLSAYLGPLVLLLLLLFFHWHHLSTIPLSSPPDQREKERETRLQELRQQREDRVQKGRAGVGAGEVVTSKVEKSADGSAVGQITKTNRFAQSGSL